MEQISPKPQPLEPKLAERPVSFRALIRANRVYFLGLMLFLGIGAILLSTTAQGEIEFAINRYRSPFNDSLWKVLTQLAEQYTIILFAIVLAAYSYRKALAFALLGILIPITSGGLKVLFGAPRPMRWFYDFAPEQWGELFRFPEVASTWAYTSFPSGHATSAFAVYGFLAFCTVGRSKRWVELACIAAAIVVAFSRQYLLFHFLKDVVAGAVLGTTLAVVIYLWQQYWWRGSIRMRSGFWNRD